MGIKKWVNGTASILAAGTTLAALAYGGASLSGSLNPRLPVLKPSAAQAPVSSANGLRGYIVRFSGAPVATYKGGVDGLAATAPHVLDRRMLDTGSGASLAYARYLDGRHQDFLAQASRVLSRSLAPRHSYSYAYNGMALRLTPEEAQQLAALPGVESVQPDLAFKPTTSPAPIPAGAANTEPSRAWINAPAVWAKPSFATGVAGATGNDNEGEGIVVADIDTGLNIANGSFAATGADNYTIPNPLGSGSYLGVCDSSNTVSNQPTTYDPDFGCNGKVIGAYTYTRYAYLNSNPPGSQSKDPVSPNDSEGHGSHTASTIAGDFITNVSSVSGVSSPLSGVAPHANLIVYDVCDPTDACQESDSIAAIDQAIQDQSAIRRVASSTFKGMVMNFSIGGSAFPYQDPVEQAFFGAEQAGIFVAAAGGNSGPAAGNSPLGPVEHLGPWLTTAAAATDDSVFGNNAVTVAGTAHAGTFQGQGSTAAYSSHEIVYAKNHPYSSLDYAIIQGGYASKKYTLSGQAWATPSGNATNDAAACLFPFAAGENIPAGAIVVCDRGTIALVDKADNVKQGGAGGIVIVSQSGNALVTESYEIPGTMVDNTDGTTIEGDLGSSDSASFTATLSGSALSTCGGSCTGIADQIAAFSARGPNSDLFNTSIFDNVIKPDVAAPGVQILAAVADPCDMTATAPGCSDGQQNTFDFYQGTSMATPHVTGAGALLMQLHGWTPMEVKSALMSTAVTANVGDQCATAGACTSTLPTTPSPQVAGAGRIDLAAAARAGFVLGESFTGQQALINANTNPTAAALQGFNLASLGNMQCISSCSWTRLITSTQVAASLNYTITMPSWMTVSVNGGAASSSGNLTLNNSASATLVFTATMQQASWNSWQFGEVDFTTSSNADDGSPAPAQHFPVAVYNQQPLPHMGVSPDNLLQGLSVGESAKSQTVTINNSGVLPLNWTLTSTATGTGPIVQRVLDSSGVGFPSDAFTADRHGIYLADSFSMAVSGAVTSITAMGFTQGGTSTQPSLADATQVAWYVYADANGVPAGNPEGGAAPIWSFTAAPSASGVTLVDSGNMVLNLATAGAPALNLSAGTYWLSVVPTFSNSCSYGAGGVISGGCAGEAWYWGESAPGSGKASYIDPANLLGSNAGAATGWTLMGPDTQFSQDVSGSVSLAFGLAGTLNCPANLSLGGVSLSPTSGSVAPGGSASVTANFDPTGISPGTYNGAFCVQGNDSNTPFVAVPVTETVTAATGSGGGNGGSGGGGGGGGAFGVLGLLMLFVPWMARGRGRSGG